MLVMSVQAIANIVPFTPGRRRCPAGAAGRDAEGPSRAAVLSFSVGTQIAMAAWSVVLGFAAILLVFRTTDWRGLIDSAGRATRREAAAAEAARTPAASADAGWAAAAVRPRAPQLDQPG